jgi:xylose isomerase
MFQGAHTGEPITMTKPFFESVTKIRYEGPESDNPLAFHYYDAERVVLGKTMAEHLRPAVCYWHSFVWPGSDVFGDGTFDRPWHRAGIPIELAREKASAAFEFFEKLGVPFFTFHDLDIAPEGQTLAETDQAVRTMAEFVHSEMQRTGKKLLWGTANLFGNARYAAGAATNPDPEVFACAAAQVRRALEITKSLGGANYVLWGGREGYDTLLNTDMRRELDQLGRFLSLVADHKHKIGFAGTLLIEPKPMEPTKHQYDFDAAAVYAFLQRYDLTREFKLNIEVNHATLAGHTFEHELTYAAFAGLLGSVDINRGDPQLGWDTDQFPNSVDEVVRAMLVILGAGGFETGGFNFDAKLRRQSIEPVDLFHAHIGGIDTLARALVVASSIIEEGVLSRFVAERYSRWDGELGRSIMQNGRSLEQLAHHAETNQLDPKPRSGRQELLENLIGRHAGLPGAAPGVRRVGSHVDSARRGKDR